MVPPRLSRLSWVVLRDGVTMFVAKSPLARLLGLAGLAAIPPRCALLIPRCSAVHTFGMRFPIDVQFLDADGRVLEERRHVGPRRFVRRPGAAAVLERAAAQTEPTSPASR